MPGRSSGATGRSSELVSRHRGPPPGPWRGRRGTPTRTRRTPRVGVLEPELHGVQPLPLQPEPLGEGGVGTVGQVAHARMLERGHVHPDLVGPSGLEVHLQQGREPVGLQRRVVRDAGPSLGHHRELVVRLGVPPDRCVDRALERVGVALHQRVVDLVDVAVAERVLEHRVGVLGLADDHHARRADVQPLHDPLPLRGAAGRDLEPGRGQVTDHGRARSSRARGARRRRPAC